MYETDPDGKVYVAVDEGVLVERTGRPSLGAPGRGSRHRPAARLGRARFRVLDAQEKSERLVMVKLEAGFCIAWRSFNMIDEPTGTAAKHAPTFAEPVGAKPARKTDAPTGTAAKHASNVRRTGRRARRRARFRAGRRSEGAWFGLGMMGLIGWSVAIPTLLGAALGLWLDAGTPAGFPGRSRC